MYTLSVDKLMSCPAIFSDAYRRFRLVDIITPDVVLIGYSILGTVCIPEVLLHAAGLDLFPQRQQSHLNC